MGLHLLELRDAFPEDLSVDFKLIWRNCAHFNGEDLRLASYSRKVGKQAQDILDRFARTMRTSTTCGRSSRRTTGTWAGDEELPQGLLSGVRSMASS